MRQLLVFFLAVHFGSTSIEAADWSFWRGPEQNGVSREKDLPEKWSLNPKAADNNLIFAVNQGSIATPIIQNNQVYLLGKAGEKATQQERVMAFDADTGNLLWEHRFNVWHTDIVDDRLGFTHMAGDPETGNVYAHMTSGMFVCFSKEGKILWEISTTEEFGRVTGYGGRVTSPIIDEDKVILGMVNSSWGELTIGNTRMVAMDKKTGKVIWWGSGNYRVKDTYYSTPVVHVIAGQRLILTGGGDGCIHAFKVRTGEKVWSYRFEDGGGAVNCSPVVKGNLIWIGHGEENVGNGTQGRVICLDASQMEAGQPKLVWKYDGIKVKFASPVLHEGLLYLCDDAGKLYCFDAEKGGEPLWNFEYGKNTKGSPTWADGKIYISEVDSKFHILRPSREGCQRVHELRFRGKGGIPVELQGSPAIVNGRVYFTTTNQLVCIGKKNHSAKADPIPPMTEEAPAEKSGEPAHIQVVPADVTIRPGETVNFQVFTYDSMGRRLGKTEANWEKASMLPPVYPVGLAPPKPPGKPVPPPTLLGELSAGSGAESAFKAAASPAGQFGRVDARLGKWTGNARVRVAPNLPYAIDFEKVPLQRTPGGWVNTIAKFAVVELEGGNKVLRKRNDSASPLVARANAYIGDPQLKDYTIEAEMMGTKVRDKDMPDMGVGACRYSLLLIGNDQEIRLVTWDAQKRVEKNLPFAWKPGVWYRLKLSTTVVDGKGLIKGKVWNRDEKEPESWTVEMEDPVPNTSGSPFIYGFANGTIDAANPGSEIFYDNLKITPNKK
ncbi:MAG: PQQ-binding-like beta-propeller repeat protein [Gemmataceae bacterium]